VSKYLGESKLDTICNENVTVEKGKAEENQ
jgi:hypothetical protein